MLAAVCFATLGPLTRFAEEAGVTSLTLVTWRAGLGAAVMVGFIGARWATGIARPVRLGAIPARDRRFMLAAIVANATLNLSVFIAFTRISIALALLVFYLYPAIVAVVSVIWFGERLDRLRWLALGVSLVGLVLVLAGAGGVGEIDALGVGLAFFGGLAQVFFVLAARHGFAHIPGPQAAGLTMAGACTLYLHRERGHRRPRAAGGAGVVRGGPVAGAGRGRHRRGRADGGVHHRHPHAGAEPGGHPRDARAGRGRRAGGMAAGGGCRRSSSWSAAS